MMMVFFAVAVAVVVFLVRWIGRPGHVHPWHAPPGDQALDALKLRFARGEIDKEVFEDRRRILSE